MNKVTFSDLVKASLTVRVLLAKGAGHKYIKRIPIGMTPTGRTKYRYIYKETHTVGGKHLLDEAHLKVGAKLMLESGQGKQVHAHIIAVNGNKVTIEYDDGARKGETKTLTKQELLNEFDEVHGIGAKIRASKPANTPASKPANTPASKPANTPASKPASEPASKPPYSSTDLNDPRLDKFNREVMTELNNLSKEGWNMLDVVADLRRYSNKEPSSTVDKWSIVYELRDNTTITIAKDDDGKTGDSHRMRTVTVEKNGTKKTYSFEISSRHDNRDYAFDALFEFAEGTPSGTEISNPTLPPRDLTGHMAARATIEDILNE